MGIGVAQEVVQSVARKANCKASELPFSYLGLPFGESMLSLSSWSIVIDKFYKKSGGWKARFLSIGGRLTLINYVISVLPLYYFSIFRVPEAIIKKLGCSIIYISLINT